MSLLRRIYGVDHEGYSPVAGRPHVVNPPQGGSGALPKPPRDEITITVKANVEIVDVTEELRNEVTRLRRLLIAEREETARLTRLLIGERRS